MVIAIDGPAGSGKSTVARAVAKALGWTYLDSGAMYRSVALAAMQQGIDPADGGRLGGLARELPLRLSGPVVEIDGQDVGEAIRTPEVSAAASLVAAHPAVREAMVDQQRALIESGRYVAEGRDIGTVVSPESPLKVFLTADVDERARRRAAQTGEEGMAVAAAIRDRDARDTARDHSPLVAAADAVELDTTALTVAEVVTAVVELAEQRGLA